MSIFKRATAQFFNLDGETTDRYWVIGDSKNPCLLIIPGFTGTHSDLLVMTNQLREKYFLIIPDMPGWGLSEPLKSNMTLENYALYLEKLLDHNNIKELYIFGHCMGAAVALEFCYQFPEKVKKAILASTPYLDDNTISKQFFLHLADASLKSPLMLRPIFFFWRNRFFEIFVNYFALKFRSRHKKIQRLETGLKNRSEQIEKTVEENWISLIHLNYNKFKNLKTAILLIHGSEDLLVRPEQAVKLQHLLTNSQLKFIKNAGHLPPIETANTLERIILQYLEVN